jgi:hypothetical protein
MLPITLFVSALLGAATPAGASNAHTFAATGVSSTSVVVRYEAPAQISLGEPLIVEFIVENYGDEAVRVDLGFDRVENFVATVVDPTQTFGTITAVRLDPLEVRCSRRFSWRRPSPGWPPPGPLGGLRFAGVTVTRPEM